MHKRVLLGFVVLFVIGAAGIYLLDRTLFAPPPASQEPVAAPTLDLSGAVSLTPTSAAAQASPPQGQSTQLAHTPPSNETPEEPVSDETLARPALYRINPQQSEVRYEVGETFFQDNRFAIAVGRTSGIAGEILVDYAQPASSRIGEIVIDVSRFASDESRRDNFLARNGLASSIYPTASFVTRSIDGLPAAAAPADKIQLIVHGDLTVKETTRPVSWQVVLDLEDGRILGTAETHILMSDFGVGPIQIAFLRTEDEVKLVFDFIAVENTN
jgi:polyisoprenoid-binding protein YceI